MSAYLMGPDELAAIARAFDHYVTPAQHLAKLIPAITSGQTPVEALFGELLNENLASIGYRYPDAPRIADWFGDGEAAFVWANIPEAQNTAEELEHMVRSYQYQSCEHPEWEASMAKAVTDALKEALAPLVEREAKAENAKKAETLRALYARGTASAKESAALLKQALRAAFPAVEFSVRLSRGTGYGYCHVRWTDGPTTTLAQEITDRFEGSRFDGMTDSENATPSILPNDPAGRLSGLRSVITNRDISPALWQRCAEKAARECGIASVPDERAANSLYIKDRQEWFSQLVYRESVRRAVLAA